MDFLDRQQEIGRLEGLTKLPDGSVAIIWGRRRVGKSRLILEWIRKQDGLYTVADRSAPPLQRASFARAVAERFTGFDSVLYPDWTSLLARAAREAAAARWRGPLAIDELPYLVAADASLPSVLQNWVDGQAREAGLVVALAGSSASMMQGAALDASAPLYGRAREIIRVEPLSARWIGSAFGQCSARTQVELYALWGGIPRYWELAVGLGLDIESAVDALVLDPMGPLHEEADRLLQEELPPAVALRPLLELIGGGVHRLSEMSARLEQPATSLSRPLKRLVDLDLVVREHPWGEEPRESRRTLYKIADPFLRMWFSVVAPNRSLLAEAPAPIRMAVWRKRRQNLEAQAWEELVRRAVPRLHTVHPAAASLGPCMPARRYWRGSDPEVDVVAASVDGSRLLVGEAKWLSAPPDAAALGSMAGAFLRQQTGSLSVPKGAEVERFLFVPELAPGARAPGGVHVVDAAAVLAAQP